MSDQVSSPSGGEEKGGIGVLGWVVIIAALLILSPILIGFIFGVAGLALKLVFGAVAAILGAIGAVFGVVVGILGGLLGAVLGIFASMSVVLLLLLPGILIGILIARAFSGKKAD